MSSVPSAAIYDCEGAMPTADEKAFFKEADPLGFIVFARHCETLEATRALCTELREIVGRDALILIDQEGGRVTRMKAPTFPAHPPMATFGRLWKLDPRKAIEAARLNAELLGRMVRSAGVTVDCVPMLDVPQLDADPIVIGDRALATHTDQIIELGRAVMEGVIAGGALPVIKHMPGHGRALCDSHHELPTVVATKDELRVVDFAPFKALNDAALGMTGHVVYSAFDPDLCATMSPTIISDVIRGEIGFEGLLISDDLKMKALGGPIGQRAGDCLKAGCDVALCCNFDMAEKVSAAAHVVPLSDAALARASKAIEAVPSFQADSETDDRYRELATLIKPAEAA